MFVRQASEASSTNRDKPPTQVEAIVPQGHIDLYIARARTARAILLFAFHCFYFLSFYIFYLFSSGLSKSLILYIQFYFLLNRLRFSLSSILLLCFRFALYRVSIFLLFTSR